MSIKQGEVQRNWDLHSEAPDRLDSPKGGGYVCRFFGLSKASLIMFIVIADTGR